MRLHVLYFILLLCCCKPIAAEDEYITLQINTDKLLEHIHRTTKDIMQANNNVANISEGIKINSFGEGARIRRSYKTDTQALTAPWRRTAINLYGSNSPEVLYDFRRSFSSTETIDRHAAGVYIPISEQFAFGGVLRAEYFTLDDGAESISHSLYELDIGGMYFYSPEVRFIGALVGGVSGNVLMPGLRGAAIYDNRSGISLASSMNIWVPWNENTISAEEGGRTTGLNALATLPLAERLNLGLNGAIDWRAVEEEAFSGISSEGTRFQGGINAEWYFWKRAQRRVGGNFLDINTMSNSAVTTGANLYAAVLASSYVGRPEDPRVPVTERSFDQRIGLNAAYAFNHHLGLSASAYIGYDPARNIDFGKLYGFNSRLEMVPNAKIKMYLDFSMDSESTDGIGEGKTWYAGGGFNYGF